MRYLFIAALMAGSFYTAPAFAADAIGSYYTLDALKRATESNPPPAAAAAPAPAPAKADEAPLDISEKIEPAKPAAPAPTPAATPPAPVAAPPPAPTPAAAPAPVAAPTTPTPAAEIIKKPEAPVVKKAETRPPAKKATPVKAKQAHKPKPVQEVSAKKPEKKFQQFTVNPDGSITINARPEQAAQENAYTIEKAIQATPRPAVVMQAPEPGEAVAEEQPAPIEEEPIKKMVKQVEPESKTKGPTYTARAPGPGEKWMEQAASNPPVRPVLRDLKAPPSAPMYLPPAKPAASPPPPPAAEPPAKMIPASAPPPEKPATKKEAKKAAKKPPPEPEIKQEKIEEVAGPLPPAMDPSKPPSPKTAQAAEDKPWAKAKNWLHNLKPAAGVDAKAPDNDEINSK